MYGRVDVTNGAVFMSSIFATETIGIQAGLAQMDVTDNASLSTFVHVQPDVFSVESTDTSSDNHNGELRIGANDANLSLTTNHGGIAQVVVQMSPGPGNTGLVAMQSVDANSSTLFSLTSTQVTTTIADTGPATVSLVVTETKSAWNATVADTGTQSSFIDLELAQFEISLLNGTSHASSGIEGIQTQLNLFALNSASGKNVSIVLDSPSTTITTTVQGLSTLGPITSVTHTASSFTVDCADTGRAHVTTLGLSNNGVCGLANLNGGLAVEADGTTSAIGVIPAQNIGATNSVSPQIQLTGTYGGTQELRRRLFLAVGRSTTNGGGILLTIPVPTNRQARIDITAMVRVFSNGSGNAVGDMFQTRGNIKGKNIAGTASLVQGFLQNTQMQFTSGVAVVPDLNVEGNLGGCLVTAAAGGGGTILVALTTVPTSGTLGTLDCELWAEVTYN